MIREGNSGMSRITNIDSTVSLVGRALLPVEDSDGQECPSYDGQGAVLCWLYPFAGRFANNCSLLKCE